MEKYRTWGLWLRIAIPFLLFVVVGSITLCIWLYADASREARDGFATLARTNANFIHSSRLPTSGRMAEDLSRILDTPVFFRESGNRLTPPLPASLAKLEKGIGTLTPAMGVVRLDPGYEAIETPIDASRDLIIVRSIHDSILLSRPRTWIMPVTFWGLSLVLAWALTRGVVRPLRVLALHLPDIEKEDAPALPGSDRNDEIGLLARTYAHTHRQLIAERQRREKAERLALLGKMATSLAHEINNPVSAIRMHAQLLQTGGRMDAATASALPIILGETARIESLVNQWMFLARPSPPQVSAANLGTLVEDAMTSLLPQAAHARVTIHRDIAPDLSINVDARRIRQAIGNIVINAIQAMPGGGTIHITASRDRENIRLTFQDTGRGFSEKALLHYADLFYSEKEGGMGIGLNVSSEIVKAHGGSIEVANPPGGGALVTLLFPAVNTHP